MKRAERDIARKKEYVRRVRLQIEEKRAEVSAAFMQWISDNIHKPSHHACYLTTLLALISAPSFQHFIVISGISLMSPCANLEV